VLTLSMHITLNSTIKRSMSDTGLNTTFSAAVADMYLLSILAIVMRSNSIAWLSVLLIKHSLEISHYFIRTLIISSGRILCSYN